jgi:hypothetical protein
MTFAIHKTGSKLTPESKEILIDQIRGLNEGTHYISITQMQVYTGRYKCYFSCLLPVILDQIVCLHPIEKRQVTIIEFHEICKNEWNRQPIFVNNLGLTFGGSSTRKLDDKAFFEYEERIMEYFTTNYAVELVYRSDYPAWAKHQRNLLKSTDNEEA